ncbi:MAG: ASKHA domain-containing protein [Candidatus Aerophobetes bacterium]|nr:ASKHA domain-containing protein [Candidatus Aerophobetes bacterium]
MKKNKTKVTFLPQNETIEVEKGTTLLEASIRAGVYVNSICGGDGICGKCRLVVKEGDVTAHPTTLLKREDIKKGYVLACQTEVIDDVVVEVPPESRAEGKILIDKDAQRFRALYAPMKGQVFFKYEPLIQKIHLELPPPSLQDNISDHIRLYRSIRRQKKIPIMQTGLKIIKAIPYVLRKGNWEITATLGVRGGTVEIIQVEGGNTTDRNFAVAVDVGTSTVVAHLVNLTTFETMDAEATYNSQRVYGEEVTRRIIYAEQKGENKLREAIVEDINNLITTLISRNNIYLNDIMAVVCAGNTAMIHFLLGLNPSYLRKEPYIPVCTYPPPVRAAEVGIKINPRGLLYSLPSIASWVGADITAGILATGLYQADELTMLIDIGTNGEIVIGNKDWMVCCSASAGPAFEGSGVRSGMRAAEGAIEKVKISEEGKIQYTTIGGGKPRGVCGSGLIDVMAELFKAGFLDRSGRLNPDINGKIRDVKGELEFLLIPSSQTLTKDEIVITQADIENLLRAKAAIFAGINALTKMLSIEFSDIKRIYLAGGFGNYLDKENAVTLGLIPDVQRGRVQFVGNTAILGAKMTLLSKDALDTAYKISRNITYYDLITYPDYMDEFMSAKFLPHTDVSKFPTIMGKIKR